MPKIVKNQIILKNETDLHYKVVEFIRANYPHIMMLPGLGEYQQTSALKKGRVEEGLYRRTARCSDLEQPQNIQWFCIGAQDPKWKWSFVR